MTDDNRDLVAQVARRGPVETDRTLPPTVTVDDWNAPIDTIQADCMTARAVIRGQIANAKEVARRWLPQPMPPTKGGTT